jgi:hypothetical protein
MRTPGRLSTPLGAAGSVLLAATVACGGTNPSAGHSPSSTAQASASSQVSAPAPTPSAAPQPLTGAYGLLVSIASAGGPYTVSLVGIDGKVAASGQASAPATVSCASAAGAPVPLPVSTSDTRAYFMDAAGTIRFLAPNGDTGHATAVPAGTGTRRSMFAVSPDDKRIAVVVADYTTNGASTKLYVEDLNGGGNHLDLFSESGARTLWPVGWHGTNNLVLAVVPSCTQGGGPFCCGMQELHVVDPATATRRFTVGGVTTCPIVGSPSPSGAICWDGTQSKVMSWSAATVKTYPVQGPELQYLSPSGGQIALVDNTGTSLQGTNIAIAGLFACAWIDDAHLLAGGDSQHQPRVANVTTSAVVPVPAQGDCGGRLPGGL